jgi:hypothetical protein
MTGQTSGVRVRRTLWSVAALIGFGALIAAPFVATSGVQTWVELRRMAVVALGLEAVTLAVALPALWIGRSRSVPDYPQRPRRPLGLVGVAALVVGVGAYLFVRNLGWAGAIYTDLWKQDPWTAAWWTSLERTGRAWMIGLGLLLLWVLAQALWDRFDRGRRHRQVANRAPPLVIDEA